MKIYEIFSKRQKQIRGEVPDVYEYEIIPYELRVQIVHIWKDVLRTATSGTYGTTYDHAHRAYSTFHNVLCREYGMFRLGNASEYIYQSVHNFFIRVKETEKALDVVEVSFQYIDKDVRDNPNGYFHPLISPDDAINELNHRFRERRIGYQYESGMIVKIESHIMHAEVVKPALIFLSDPMYKGANEEFLKAHEHYRKGGYKECLNECLKAFESCLKIICKKRRWHYDEKKAAAKDLIQIVFDNGLIPSFMQSHFSGLKTTLESGLPTVRNRQSGHGQGSGQVVVPEYIAGYALHLTASNILLLAKADGNMK
jgi:hypothetical protein